MNIFKVVFYINFILTTTLYSQQSSTTVKYYDINGKEISKTKFFKKRRTNEVLDVLVDSLNRKLIKRTEVGRINDPSIIFDDIEQVSQSSIDRSKPLVIIYYPGADRCNQGGFSSLEMRKDWTNRLEENLSKIAGVKPTYIYKDNDGIENYHSYLKWLKDPNQIIEKHFFKYHYPCSSFVVLSFEGNYISYFGEWSPELIFDAVKKVM